MNARQVVENALDKGHGILRLAPNWVPRVFCIPGRRICLHPDDYEKLGAARGGIDERWFASTTETKNAVRPSDEGLSYIFYQDGSRIRKATLRAGVEEHRSAIVGRRLWEAFQRWPMYSKFFDNMGPLPHHVHHRDEHAARTNQDGKPEAYYFPPQRNNHPGDRDSTYFGINPGTTKDQLRECIRIFLDGEGDNGIVDIAHSHKLKAGTGWNVPAGVLHAPGSMCTYEPQYASDVFSMYQSVVEGRQMVPLELFLKDTPENILSKDQLKKAKRKQKITDPNLKEALIEWFVEVLDWEKNVDPNFVQNSFMEPWPVQSPEQIERLGYVNKWICYLSDAFSANELTVKPRHTARLEEDTTSPYGFIVMQGHANINGMLFEAPTMIRYGQLTNDEGYVTPRAIAGGLEIKNLSDRDDFVILRHYAGGNKDLPAFMATQAGLPSIFLTNSTT